MKASTAAWVRWLLIYVVITAMVAWLGSVMRLRASLGVLVYMVLIVGASQEGVKWLSVATVALSYAAVDYFFVAPRGAFGRPMPLDIVLLVCFLATAGVIAQLVVRLRQSAMLATERAAEIERLSSERVRLEREAARADVLHEAERLQHALLASLSHDLRSPVMAMTLLADPHSNIPPADALVRVRDQARRLGDFLSTLGRFTNAATGTGAARLEAHDAEALIASAIRACAATLDGHQIVAPAVGASTHMLWCDFTLSLQILANLLQNAARYSPPGSAIEICCMVDGACTRISVSDRGPGVAEPDVAHIFQPLRRGAATAEVAPGTGMGLAIARTFAHAQRGDVTYRPREGGGAVFSLSLPSAAPAA